MPNWLRNLLAVLVGVFVGGLCIAIIEMVTHSVASGHTLFIGAVIALAIATFIGGWVSVKIGQKAYFPFIVGGLLFGLSLVNVFTFKHPIWFVPTAFILIAISAYAASRFSKIKGE